jgi:peptidoglycan/xylan/chitin deacetylase (PgdA/CDA1 family)
MSIIALMYHDVVEAGRFDTSGFQGGAADLYKLDRRRFDAHLDAIAGSGARVGVVVHEALGDGAADSVLLTFDDGGASAAEIAGALDARGWRGHFFITTDYIGESGFVSERDVRALQAAGHVVGSHSCSHPERMSHCTRDQLVREWRDSAARIADITGRPVTVASVPGGFYSRAVADAALEAGVEVLFTSEPTTRVERVGRCHIIGRFAMERLDPREAGRLAGGAVVPRMKQAILWKLKGIAKAVGGRYWLRARRRVLDRRAPD